MSEKKYYPGFVDVDLQSGKYNVVSEQNPDTLIVAEDKFNKFLGEAKDRNYSIGEIYESTKPNIIKEVMVIGDGLMAFAYISDKYMPIIDPWDEQIQSQMQTYDMFNMGRDLNREKSIFSKIIDLFKA